MNQQFLDVLHDERESIKHELQALSRLIYAMDDLGFDRICEKMWRIHGNISSSNDAIYDAYGQALNENFTDSMEAAAQTFEAAFNISKETDNG